MIDVVGGRTGGGGGGGFADSHTPLNGTGVRGGKTDHFQ